MHEIKNTLDAHNQIRSFLASSRDILPPLPEILVKMQSAINDSKIDARTLSQIILKDPSLTAKIMKLANSAYYRHGKNTVDTVTDAIVIMGFEAIRNVVLGLSVYNIMNKLPRVEGYKNIWRHSLCCAVCAQRLAEIIKIPVPESIFVGGLLHDIGKLILAQVFPEHYARVMDIVREEDSPVCKTEHKVLNTNHAKSGELVANFWNFPKHVTHAILHHELQGNISEFKKFDNKETNIIILSNVISHFVYGKEPGFPEVDLPDIIELSEKTIDVDGDKIYELVNKLKGNVANIAKILDMESYERATEVKTQNSATKLGSGDPSESGSTYPLIPRSLVYRIDFRGVKPAHLASLKEKLSHVSKGGIAAEVDTPPIIDSIAEVRFRYDKSDPMMQAIGLVKWIERVPKKIVGIQFLRIDKIETDKLETGEMPVVSSPAATTVEIKDNTIVIKGEFASSSQEGFMHCWSKLLKSSHQELVIDINKVFRISSMAIGLLVGAQMDVVGEAKKLTIKISYRFKRILAVAGVEKVLNVVYDAEVADDDSEEQERIPQDNSSDEMQDATSTKEIRKYLEDDLEGMTDPAAAAEAELLKDIEQMKKNKNS